MKPKHDESRSGTRAFVRADRVAILAVAVILVLSFTFAGYMMICKNNNKVAYVFGTAVIRITTGSMGDTIPTGTYILVKRAAPEDISENDIITFRSRNTEIYGEFNTHRVIKINSDGSFETKGDGNPTVDKERVDGDALEAKYVRSLEVFTALMSFMSNGAVFVLIIMLPICCIALFFLRVFVERVRQAKIEAEIAAEVERMRQLDETAKERSLPDEADRNDKEQTDK